MADAPPSRDLVKEWLADLQASWEGADASESTISRLFSDDAVYCPDPLELTELRGHAAIQKLWTQDDTDLGRPSVRIGEPVVEWPRAMVSWWAVFEKEDGSETLAGMFSLLFGPEGRCLRLAEAWMQAPEAKRPPACWEL